MLNPKMLIAAFGLATAGMLFFAPVAVQAQDNPNIEARCAENPEKCAAIRARLAEQCAKDPAACEARKEKMQQRAAELRAKCEADPQACAFG